MKTIRLAGLAVALTAPLYGCASMEVSGPQDIQLSIVPTTALCQAYQHGDVVGRYDPSRQSITVPASLGSTDIVCSAPDYKDRRVSIVPDGMEWWRPYLIDFGPAKMPEYAGTLQIVMERADRPGTPR